MNRPSLDLLKQQFDRFRQGPFPRLSTDCPEELLDAWGELVDYDSAIAGCVSQLVNLEPADRDLDLCRRVLIIDERLSEQLSAAPDQPTRPIKQRLLNRKSEIDELIRLAQQVLEDLD